MTFGQLLTPARASRAALVLAFGARILFAGTASADPAAEAKKIFTTRCTACHTFGKGVKVGPDLKGVTDRRQRAWLLKFIRSSQTVIGSGDPIASGLFEQFKQQRMPDWTDLSEEQIGSILDWLAIGGPDQQESDARPAESATLVEIETGRQLFHGARALARGGIACASCHGIHDQGGASGGTLAPDLTAVYSQYQDGAMTQFLKHPCVLRFPESTQPAFLVPEEAFAIKAYLRFTALNAQPSDQTAAGPVTAPKPIDAGSGGGATSGSGAAAPTAGKRVAWAPKVAGSTSSAPRRAALPSELLFLVFPYLALAILIIGCGVRHALARRKPDAIGPAAKTAWQLLRGSWAWRIGLAVTLALHLLFLIVPGAIRSWNGAPLRLYVLEGTGFVLGVVALVGLLQLMSRQTARGTDETPVRLPEIADYVLLSLLFVAIVSGLAAAVRYRWGSSWAVGTLTPYLRSLARGAPETALVGQMPFAIRLHTFTWFAVLAVVPFTSFAALLVAAVDRVGLFAARLIAAAAQAGQRALAKFSPARWLWPEEDLPGDGGDAKEPS